MLVHMYEARPAQRHTSIVYQVYCTGTAVLLIDCCCTCKVDCVFFFLFSQTSTFQLLDKPWSQVSSLFPPRFMPSIFIVHRRVQQSHCSSIFHRVWLTHALALSASQFVHKKRSQRIYTRAYTAPCLVPSRSPAYVARILSRLSTYAYQVQI